MTESKRLAKYIADAGLGSRREVERWILAGRVVVNGTQITSPALNVTAADTILVDGKPVALPAVVCVYAYHKPAGVLTTRHDPQGRPTIYDKLPPALQSLKAVGRLDMNSEGLLLLTNNGDLAQRLMRGDAPRTYKVRVHPGLSAQHLQQLAAGMTVAGIHYAPIKIQAKAGQAGRNQWYELTLTEGKNREIRKLIEACGSHVTRLIRTAYGPIQLGKLQLNEVRDIPQHLVRKL